MDIDWDIVLVPLEVAASYNTVAYLDHNVVKLNPSQIGLHRLTFCHQHQMMNTHFHFHCYDIAHRYYYE